MGRAKVIIKDNAVVLKSEIVKPLISPGLTDHPKLQKPCRALKEPMSEEKNHLRPVAYDYEMIAEFTRNKADRRPHWQAQSVCQGCSANPPG